MYLTNVEGIARRFVDEKREYLQVGGWSFSLRTAGCCTEHSTVAAVAKAGGASTSGAGACW